MDERRVKGARPQNKKMLLQKVHTVCCTFSLTFLPPISRGRDPATMGREKLSL